MIDYQLKDGDLLLKGPGDLKMIEGIEAKKQSMITRLVVEKGSFVYDEALGSRLKLLLSEKPSRVNRMGDLYVREALEPEEGIEITNVDIKWLDKKRILILVYFSWNDIQESLEVII